MKKTELAKGFTMIELLVVIAILALLTAIVMTSLSAVQQRARDTRRMEDINMLQKAVALYSSGNFGIYPIETATTTITETSTVGSLLIASGAIPSIPRDPAHPTYTYQYVSNSVGSRYSLSFCLETDSIKNYSKGCRNIITP
ncbi:MAG TPA: type II secretion system protein [Candidatus Paceibacterota bacterium]